MSAVMHCKSHSTKCNCERQIRTCPCNSSTIFGGYCSAWIRLNWRDWGFIASSWKCSDEIIAFGELGGYQWFKSQAPNVKPQTNSKTLNPEALNGSFWNLWILVFGICLRFGFWDLMLSSYAISPWSSSRLVHPQHRWRRTLCLNLFGEGVLPW